MPLSPQWAAINARSTPLPWSIHGFRETAGGSYLDGSTDRLVGPMMSCGVGGRGSVVFFLVFSPFFPTLLFLFPVCVCGVLVDKRYNFLSSDCCLAFLGCRGGGGGGVTLCWCVTGETVLIPVLFLKLSTVKFVHHGLSHSVCLCLSLSFSLSLSVCLHPLSPSLSPSLSLPILMPVSSLLFE